ncbi:MAG TPA: DoxX family protein [Kofleriaceae bacterium]|nr:DoxX family protein [Kofleriaceae bacterium]
MPARTPHETYPRKTRALLWTIQAVLALLFLFAGVVKLATPAAELAQQSPLPPLLLKFIGLAEAAGALGLVLPGLLRIGRSLTSLAAAGLVLIMAGATVITVAAGQIGPAVFPAVIGLLAAFVAYKRWEPARDRGDLLAPSRPAA